MFNILLACAAFIFVFYKAEAAEQSIENFLDENKDCKVGLIIGRQHSQGINEDCITDSRLKGTTWLYLDPENKNYHDSDLKASWPNLTLKETYTEKFDVVAIDRYTLLFLEEAYQNQCVKRFEHIMKLQIDVTRLPEGTYNVLASSTLDHMQQVAIMSFDFDKSASIRKLASLPKAQEISGKFYLTKSSFDFGYKFEDWILQNNPIEYQELMKTLEGAIEASEKNYKTVYGIIEAFRAVKPGGCLFIGEDYRLPTLTNVAALSKILSIDPALIDHQVKDTIVDPTRSDKDPFMPAHKLLFSNNAIQMEAFFASKPSE